MLSTASRILTYATAALAAATGAILFFAPEQMAPVFAWKVTPFMVMTIGGWCLGNAWLAWRIARRWEWRLHYPSAIYLWQFGLLEAAVLIAFRDKLALGNWVAWLYVAMLAANLLTAIWGIVDWLRLRPPIRPAGQRVVSVVLRLAWFFVFFVGFLGLYGLMAPMGAPGTNGGIFPEVMSAFTLRSFGAFYLALALGATPLVVTRDMPALVFHAFASYMLLVAITAAALVYFRLFHFADAPGGLLYFGAYLAVGIAIGVILVRWRAAVMA